MYRGKLVRVLAVAAALSLGVAGCAQDAKKAKEEEKKSSEGPKIKADPAPPPPSDYAKPAGDGKGKCPAGTKIAYVGTITGNSAALGVNILNSAKLAVKEHNAANKGCQVKLVEAETQGDPTVAPGVVAKLIKDPKVIGIVGVVFSGESNAVGPALSKAGLVALSPSATNPDLAGNKWRHFFRGLGNDAVQGPFAAEFIDKELKAKKVCVVQDDSEYGIGLADTIRQKLGDKVTCNQKVKTKQKEFNSVAGEIASEDPDAIFFSGYYPEAAPFVDQLKNKGYEGAIVAPDGVRDNEFVKGAGESAEGVYLTCPCLPSEGYDDFKTAYSKESGGQEPGTYSPESYDATTILLQGLDKGNTTRDKLREFVKNYEGQGLTKQYKFNENGEVEQMPVWVYKVENGKIVHLKDMGIGKP